MKKSYSFALGLIFAFAINTSAQIPGMVDSSFNGNGKVIYDFGFHENLTDVKVQPFDQKVVTVGTALTPSFSGKLLAIRLLPNGAFDTTFNDSGIVIIPNFNESYAYETIIKDDGKILIAGTAADPNFIFSTLVLFGRIIFSSAICSIPKSLKSSRSLHNMSTYLSSLEITCWLIGSHSES